MYRLIVDDFVLIFSFLFNNVSKFVKLEKRQIVIQLINKQQYRIRHIIKE